MSMTRTIASQFSCLLDLAPGNASVAVDQSSIMKQQRACALSELPNAFSLSQETDRRAFC